MVTGGNGLEWARKLVADLECLKKVLIIGDSSQLSQKDLGGKIVIYDDLKRKVLESGIIFKRAEDVNARDLVYLSETTGTTGPPKGVMHGHLEAMVNMGVVKRHPDCPFLEPGPGSVSFSLTPFSHASSFIFLFPTIFGGGKIIFLDMLRFMSKGFDGMMEVR